MVGVELILETRPMLACPDLSPGHGGLSNTFYLLKTNQLSTITQRAECVWVLDKYPILQVLLLSPSHLLSLPGVTRGLLCAQSLCVPPPAEWLFSSLFLFLLPAPSLSPSSSLAGDNLWEEENTNSDLGCPSVN